MEHAIEHPAPSLRGVATTKFAFWLLLASEAIISPRTRSRR